MALDRFMGGSKRESKEACMARNEMWSKYSGF